MSCTFDNINSFFAFDVERFGRKAADANVPLEINGATHYRIQSANLPAPLQLLRAGYRQMQSAGAEFVSGSDQHGFGSDIGRTGNYVPWETFQALDLSVDDLADLEAFGATR